MKLWMITGNATDDGAPIYLQTHGRWTRKLSAGYPVSGEEERDALLAQAKAEQRIVCDPYAITVERGSLGHLAPTSLRERIRAEGPTVVLVGAAVSRPAAVGA